MARSRLLVFLKAARPGTVKTRLAATIGPVRALAAYGELVATTLAAVAELGSDLDVELRFTPDEARPEVESWLQPGWRAVPQGEGDLGARLTRAFADAFADSCPHVLVIGSDCPYLTAHDLRTALEALAQADLVLGPAADGGYWLLGLRAAYPEVFSGINWSTPQVRRQTLARARLAGLTLRELRTLSDVDTEAEWLTWRNAGSGTASPSLKV
ncbi:MAG TPA: TIGR04282 family arsenosugar biosynthesis glycosyltransferase [Candidatus Limnocylindria bacterium]|jgi:rSAM/selenodomain-associated transferase 1|nr:TIGR04282 family arsenosugar biosynthesis glycosyltransferase [Candidatus Limnocylindria bacterium]